LRAGSADSHSLERHLSWVSPADRFGLRDANRCASTGLGGTR
jgi:hypothetical protein